MSWLRGKPGLVVADGEADLPDCIAAAAAAAHAGARLATTADQGRIDRLRGLTHAR